MKKLIALWAVCLLVPGLLTACGVSAKVLPSQDSPMGSAPAPSETSAIHYEVHTRTLENAAFDKETKLAGYEYDLPNLTAVRSDGTEIETPITADEKAAMARTETFNRKFEEWVEKSDFDTTVQMATEDLAWHRESGLDWLEGYDEELKFSVWQTDHLVSIAADYYSYTGGAHPNTALLSWNFNLDTGEFVTPMMLAKDDQEFLDGVKEEILRQAEQTARENGYQPEEYYLENYRDIAAEWSNYAVSFDQNGMNVGFSPYEIACYAVGPQTFTVGYQTLSPWLSDAGKQTLNLTAEQ